MRILIVSPYATVAPHFETELEIAERHQRVGHEVLWMSCTGELANCDFNRTKSAKTCRDCSLRRAHGYSLLRCQPSLVALDELPHRNGRSNELQVPDFQTIQDLREYTRDGFDLGYAVLSSLVSAVRDPEPDLMQHRDLIEAFFQSAWQTFRSVGEFLKRKSVDRVYIFNGRFAAMRAVLRACQQGHIECLVHERGATMEQFELYQNHLPHDIQQVHALIESHWMKANDIQKSEAVAIDWFENRRQRVERNWVSFTKNQQVNRLPESWNRDRRNLVIFTSSDDEFVAIGDSWRPTLYADQLSGIQKIVADFMPNRRDTRVYVRVHPNLAGIDNATSRAMMGLKAEGLEIIPPDSPIDSYSLMDVANTVVTFGSSIGIEAAYWGKPSVLLGPCFYQGLGSVYRPADHRETLEFLNQTLPSCNPTGALKYAYWLNTHGIPFEFFRPESWYHGRFKGEVVYARQPKLSRWERAKKRLGIPSTRG